METKVYLDYAATTPVDPEVLEAMLPYLRDEYGNPSSLYAAGQRAKKAIEDAREIIAGYVSASPEEIVFTGCGSEANNWALVGTAQARKRQGGHIVVSAFEHPSVMEAAKFLAGAGYDVTYVRPGSSGIVEPDQISAALTDETIIVSVMLVNNEVGTVQPVADIARLCTERGIVFHTDAVQAVAKLPVDVAQIGCGLMSLAAHKLYAPKGVGAMYIKKGTKITPFIRGGGQEGKRRAGTHNVAGIVGFGKAIELAVGRRDDDQARIARLSEALLAGLHEKVGDIGVNGDRTRSLPNILNVLVRGVEGESLLLHLDAKGVAVSTGSACSSGSLAPSHVLLAMDIPQEDAHSSLRLTIGRLTTREEIDYLLDVLPPIVFNLRAMSPLYQEGQRV